MESSTAQFLSRQFACAQLPNAWALERSRNGNVYAACQSARRHLLHTGTYPQWGSPGKLAQEAKTSARICPAGGSCVLLPPKWELAGEVQVAVLRPADCVEGLP